MFHKLISERQKGVLLILCAALLWSTGGVFIKSVSLNAFQISFWRSFFAGVTILIFVFRRYGFHNLTNFSQIFQTIHPSTLIPAFAYAATLILFVLGNKLTTAANAILLQYTAPVYILALAHVVLGERMTTLNIGTVLVCILGMSVFFLDQLSSQGVLGNIFSLLSGVSFALMTVYLRKNKHGDPLIAILVGNILIVALSLWIGILNEQASLTDFIRLSFTDIVIVGFLGIFQIALPYMFFAIGIKSVPALEASMISMIEPILNPIWVIIFVGEIPSHFAIIGGAIIIVAVSVQNWIQSKQEYSHKTIP